MKKKFELPEQTRRSFIRNAMLSAGAAGGVFGGFGIDPFMAAAMAADMGGRKNP